VTIPLSAADVIEGELLAALRLGWRSNKDHAERGRLATCYILQDSYEISYESCRVGGRMRIFMGQICANSELIERIQPHAFQIGVRQCGKCVSLERSYF